MHTYQVLLKDFCTDAEDKSEDLLLNEGDDELILGGRLAIGMDGHLYLFRTKDGDTVGERIPYPYQILIDGKP